MIGHQQIIKTRLQGMRPAAVFIEYDLAEPVNDYPWQHPEKAIQQGALPVVHIDESDVVERLDIRFLAGCRVHLHCKTMNDSALNLATRIAESNVPHLVVMSMDTQELIEFKNNEWISWGEA